MNRVAVFALLRNFYDEGALLLADESSVLAELLVGLNSLDFRFASDVFIMTVFSLLQCYSSVATRIRVCTKFTAISYSSPRTIIIIIKQC